MTSYIFRPPPAEDYIEGKLDLNEHLVKHPAAIFFVRVSGDSMIGAGIHCGDLQGILLGGMS